MILLAKYSIASPVGQILSKRREKMAELNFGMVWQ